MTDRTPYWSPVDKVGAVLQGRGSRGPAKSKAGWVPFPEPQMDWEILREAKVRCETQCAGFNNLMGSCRFALSPDMGCHRFLPGGVSEVEKRPDKELDYMMRQSAGGTP